MGKPLRVLALDTTTERESVAVAEGDLVRGEVRLLAPDSHSRHVLSAVEFLLGQLGLAAGEIDAFAVTVGPGSFTGIRVGVSTAQGLAMASGRPCLGVSTLDVLAARAAGTAEHVVAVMDAYRDGEVFAAAYDGAGRPLRAPARLGLDDLLSGIPAAAAFIGDGAIKHAEAIRAAKPGAHVVQSDLFLAATLGRMAAARLERGLGVPPQELRPLYLREADIRPARP